MCPDIRGTQRAQICGRNVAPLLPWDHTAASLIDKKLSAVTFLLRERPYITSHFFWPSPQRSPNLPPSLDNSLQKKIRFPKNGPKYTISTDPPPRRYIWMPPKGGGPGAENHIRKGLRIHENTSTDKGAFDLPENIFTVELRCVQTKICCFEARKVRIS